MSNPQGKRTTRIIVEDMAVDVGAQRRKKAMRKAIKKAGLEFDGLKGWKLTEFGGGFEIVDDQDFSRYIGAVLQLRRN